jgi:hypothetical protein
VLRNSHVCVALLAATMADLTPNPAHGQAAPAQPGTLVVDLALDKEVDTAHVVPGRYVVVIKNRAPKYSYTVSVSVGTEAIAPLQDVLSKKGGLLQMSSLCSATGAVDKAVTALQDAEEEKAVPDRVFALESEMAKGELTDGCPSDPKFRGLVRAATTLIDSTRLVYPDSRDPTVYDVAAGQYVRVSVTRQSGKPGSGPTWTKTFTTGAPGEWRATFGFAFPVLSGIADDGLFGDQRSYFAKDIGDGKFLVAPERTPRRFAIVPTVMFSYKPAHDEPRWLGGWTAGVGTDLENPVVLAGYGRTYFSNLHFSIGALMRQEDRLLGKYRSGDTLTSALSTEQLHDKDWRLRPYFSVTFRFADNPFGSSGKPASGEAPAEEKKPKASTSGGTSP